MAGLGWTGRTCLHKEIPDDDDRKLESMVCSGPYRLYDRRRRAAVWQCAAADALADDGAAGLWGDLAGDRAADSAISPAGYGWASGSQPEAAVVRCRTHPWQVVHHWRRQRSRAMAEQPSFRGRRLAG